MSNTTPVYSESSFNCTYVLHRDSAESGPVPLIRIHAFINFQCFLCCLLFRLKCSLLLRLKFTLREGKQVQPIVIFWEWFVLNDRHVKVRMLKATVSGNDSWRQCTLIWQSGYHVIAYRGQNRLCPTTSEKLMAPLTPAFFSWHRLRGQGVDLFQRFLKAIKKTKKHFMIRAIWWIQNLLVSRFSGSCVEILLCYETVLQLFQNKESVTVNTT